MTYLLQNLGAALMLPGPFLSVSVNPWLITAMVLIAIIVICFAISKLKYWVRLRRIDRAIKQNMDRCSGEFGKMAETILEGVGGKGNVTAISNCIVRLKLEVKDRLLVDEKLIKSSGAAGIIRPGKTSVQVIIGPKVQFVAEEFKKLCR